MPKPSDVGKTVIVDGDQPGYRGSWQVKILMWIKGPKGECYLYDTQYIPYPYHDNFLHQSDGIRAFMEFNNAE